MTKSKILILLALAVSTAPAQDTYARAFYLKWKPGMIDEGQKFIKDVALKVAGNWATMDPNFVGQVTMSRVFPTEHETGYDRLRILITSKPPDLASSAVSVQYLQGIGMTPEAYAQKLGSFMETIKSEIWQSVYRHGSIKTGDFVELRFQDPPTGKGAEYQSYLRDWESAMRAGIVKAGPAKGMEAWRLQLTPDAASYNFVNLIVYPDSSSIFKGWGNRQEVLGKVHPGKDYHAYRTTGDALTRGTHTVVFRVDSAVWK